MSRLSLSAFALTTAAALVLAACGKTDAPAAPAAASAASASASASAAGASALAAYVGSYKIVGKAPGAKDGTVVAIEDTEYTPDRKTVKLAQAEVKGEQFVLEGQVDQPRRVRVTSGDYYIDMILEKGEFTATLDEATRVAQGGTLNQEVYAYLQRDDYLQAQANANAAQARIFKGVNMKDRKAVQKAYERASQADLQAFESSAAADIETAAFDALIADTTKPAALRAAALAARPQMMLKEEDAARLVAAADALEKEVGSTHDLTGAKRLAEKQLSENAAKANVAAGKPYVDVSVTDAKGEPLKLSNYVGKNKAVLLDFWASWCGPCREMIPELKKLYASYHAKGFEIVSVSIDEDQDAWRKAMGEEKMPWPQGIDPKGNDAPSASAYGVSGIPATFLINAKGEIVASDLHDAKALREKVGELMAKP